MITLVAVLAMQLVRTIIAEQHVVIRTANHLKTAYQKHRIET